jgi:colanic acid/amylovoran biosynthesis protein
MGMNILILNIHSSCNAGDAALTQVAIEQLKNHFPESCITLIMNDPNSYRGREQTLLSFLAWVNLTGTHQAMRFLQVVIAGLMAVITKQLVGRSYYTPLAKGMHQTIHAILSADIVVCTPGGYLFSYGRGRALIIMIYSMVLAILAGKPLYLFPQSIGPFKYKREKFLAHWVLNHARVVMAREPASLQYLRECRINPERCYLLPDMAFAFNPASEDAARSWLIEQGVNPDRDRPFLGITVIDWKIQYPGFENQEAYEAAIASTVKYFIEHYRGKVFFFPQSYGPSLAEDDREPAQRIVQRLSVVHQSTVLVKMPLPPDMLKAIFGQMDVFIGTRMHSNIFALSMGVPVIAIGYLHKTRGIAQSIGMEDWVIEIKDINSQQLIEQLNSLWDQRAQIRTHLLRTMPGIAEQAGQAGEILAKDYLKLTKKRT